MRALQQYVPSYAILCGVALLVVPVAALEPLWLSILAALAALAAVVAQIGRSEWPRPFGALGILLAALVVWGALSTTWSNVPSQSASQALRLFLFAAGALFLLTSAMNLDSSGQRKLEGFLLGGVTIGLMFILFELATGGLVHGALNDFEPNPVRNLFELNRASSVISIAVWVAIIAGWRKYGWPSVAGLLLVTGLSVYSLQPGSPFLAILTATGVFVLAWLMPRLTPALMLTAVAISVAAVPFIAEVKPILESLVGGLGASEFSLLHRMEIWEFASQRVNAQPLVGWGLDASRSVGAGQLVGVYDAPIVGARAVDVLPLHPHNALIQAWLELGLPGALIVGGIFACLILIMRRSISATFDRAAAYAAFTAAFVNAQLSFGIWQGWWLSCLALLAILITALVSPPRADADTSGHA